MTVDRFTIESLGFPVRGDQVSADLYRPEGATRPPVVIMAHGFGARRSYGLPPYAERFARAGMAVLLFDYRGFGASEGVPRAYVDPTRHLEDWRTAIHFARGLYAVDGRRLALWGSSFSGGHALVSAARIDGIRAVTVQVPFVDGLSSLGVYPKSLLPAAVAAGLRDLAATASGKPPIRIPITAHSGLRCLAGEDCHEGYQRLVPPGETHENEVPARILLKIGLYRPLTRVASIEAPVQIFAARHDSLIPIAAVEKAARKIPECELHVLDMGHFDPYFGEIFETVSTAQTAFLTRHLL